MAKRRRKRKIKSNVKQTAKLLLFCVFLFAGIVYLHSLTRPTPLDVNQLPPTSQDLEPVAIGIDVSEWQEDINWKAVKRDGYSFAIIRTSFGIDDNEDNAFREHVEGAKKAGLDVGAYHYSHATTIEEALMEAEFFIELLDDYQWEYPVYYDIETDRQDHLSKQELTEIALAFMDRLSEEGYEVGIYAAQYWLYHRLDINMFEDYETWIASYTDYLDYEYPYQMWQYTDKGDVNGIDGHVDINISYYDYPSYIKSARKNNY